MTVAADQAIPPYSSIQKCPTTPTIRLTYAPDLVEEAVLLAERTVPPADARAFRRDRDRIYAVVDERARETAFGRCICDGSSPSV